MGNTVRLHLRDDLCDEGMPVAHTDVDFLAERLREQLALKQSPARERGAFRQRFFAETDFSVTMLELFHHLRWHGTAGGDVGKILGHLAEAVWGSVSEEKDGCVLVGHWVSIQECHPMIAGW
jgi:hypothetical protein